MSDLRYALRSLLRARWFTLGAIATFAIGIGANVAVFSLVDRLLFRPLPYDKPSDLVVITPVEGGRMYLRTPKPLVTGARMTPGVFSGVAVAGQSSGYALDPAAPDAPAVRLTSATYNLLGVLGVRPTLGRDFTRDDAVTRRQVALLTNEVWQRRFGGDISVIGRRLGSGDSAVEIIGILPAGFTPPSMFWQQPTDGLSLDPDLLESAAPREGVWPAVARLADGVSPAAAQSAMDAVAARVSPDVVSAGQPPLQVIIAPLQDALFRRFHLTLWLVVSAAAMVLLIACANLSSLFLARGRGRELTVALCTALGASASRVALVAFFECLVVASAGAVAALAALEPRRQRTHGARARRTPAIRGRHTRRARLRRGTRRRARVHGHRRSPAGCSRDAHGRAGRAPARRKGRQPANAIARNSKPARGRGSVWNAAGLRRHPDRQKSGRSARSRPRVRAERLVRRLGRPAIR